jgi:transcriptional regulator with XRE-family HTH domain
MSKKQVTPTATEPAAIVPAGKPLWQQLATQLMGWGQVLASGAAQATDLGLAMSAAKSKNPKTQAQLRQAGVQIKRWREAAGLTLQDVTQALNLGDSALMEQAELGKVGLPFEMILRLASVLGRRDPLPVLMALTRHYNPKLWQLLEDFGLGRLVIQGVRERELANIYRANDAARQLSDAQFAQVLAFTKQAFDSALGLVESVHKTAQTSPSKPVHKPTQNSEHSPVDTPVPKPTARRPRVSPKKDAA